MQGLEIKQGASLTLSYGLDDDSSLAGWSCKVAVKTAMSASTDIMALNMTQQNAGGTRFITVVSGDTTNGWDLGDYFLVARVWNPATGEGQKFQAELRILEDGIH